MAEFVVAVSSRALFNLEKEHEVFLRGTEAEYTAYQAAHQHESLMWGTAYPLVRRLLAMNTPGEPPLTKVVLLSRNDPRSGGRMMAQVEREGLPIARAVFTRGREPFKYLGPLGAHLFLSADPADVIAALRAGVAAATVMPRPELGTEVDEPENELRIAFDGDSVLFDGSADAVFKRGRTEEEGARLFDQHERDHAEIPMPKGPFAPVLEALCRIQRTGNCPVSIRTALVTARAVAAYARAMKTLSHWEIEVDEAMFLSGDSKADVLGAFRPHIFFDDSLRHVNQAKALVPTGHVPPFGEGPVHALSA